MTLKELFDKYSFDDLYPFLLGFIRGRENNAHNFREAYDLIKLYEPVKNFADKIYIRDRGAEYGAFRYIIRFVEADPWPFALYREIVYEEEGEHNEVHLLAACLYEMTFYGFCEEEITGQGDELGLFWQPKSPLLKAAEIMDRKCNDNWSMRMNRAKRKRIYRQEKSAERLHRLAARDQLMMRMGLAFPKEEIAHIRDMHKGYECFYRSTIADGDERLPYIMKSIKDYQVLTNLKEYEAAYFWLHVPTNFPWPEEPWLAFQRELTEYLGMPIRFGIVEKEASCDEVGGFLLLYKQ